MQRAASKIVSREVRHFPENKFKRKKSVHDTDILFLYVCYISTSSSPPSLQTPYKLKKIRVYRLRPHDLTSLYIILIYYFQNIIRQNEFET